MQLSDIFLGLGEATFQELMRAVSIGRLKTYQIFDRVKTRLQERDEEFATDVAQTILVSHLDMIRAVLDFLEVPHEDGFFAKDADVTSHLSEGWRERVWEKFHATFPPAALLFYINHLAWEIAKAEDVFAPAA